MNGKRNCESQMGLQASNVIQTETTTDMGVPPIVQETTTNVADKEAEFYEENLAMDDVGDRDEDEGILDNLLEVDLIRPI
jgi:hypothetical protein